ncbi:MAG: asparagine--tRNA ligase [Proteobacteria bacterium]|nr:asparagine--tRNA ligase [Pseudomonadota bacterium]
MAGVDRRIPIQTLLATAEPGNPVTVTGWVKTSRFSKNVSFLHLYDGSGPKTVQVVLSKETGLEMQSELGQGTSVKVVGAWVESRGGKQAVEIKADTVEVVGAGNPTEYPIQKKRTSFEFLRTIAHLRPRTNTFQSVFRVRNALAWQIHSYFQERGFLWIHTPIITASDAEGAGEMFRVQVGDDKEGFFGKEAFLTVSGQLAVENFAQAFTDVYTFGPTFRAENSNTARHAAEFWMIEPEIAFGDLDDVMALAEDFIRVVATKTIEQCRDDFDFFDLRIEKDVSKNVLAAVEKPFARITHDEAQDLLVASGRKFEHKVGRGEALQTEHERYLAEEHFKGPVFVTDYPREQKAFYMRVNDDERTVAATDLLVPRIGEILGGSQREERPDVLDEQLKRFDLPEAPYWWYRDLRRFGTTPHGGFGLGFERMLMWLTGMQNIRDVIPFPRAPGQADF